jgi:hypothetical protein
MDYALLPFITHGGQEYDGLPDIRAALESRTRRVASNAINNLDLLNCVVEALENQPWDIWVDHCHEESGRIHLAVYAFDMGRNLERDDRLNAGFYLQNSEEGDTETLACTRIYRVACRNGAILECEKGQSFSIAVEDSAPTNWQEKIESVIDRSFSGDGIDTDAARFRVTMTQIVSTPYERLCFLAAQGLIDDEEQCAITEVFKEAADFSVYGFINAVTQVAHRLRTNDLWARAFQLERLGGQILRGDHNLPSFDPAFAR